MRQQIWGALQEPLHSTRALVLSIWPKSPGCSTQESAHTHTRLNTSITWIVECPEKSQRQTQITMNSIRKSPPTSRGNGITRARMYARTHTHLGFLWGFAKQFIDTLWRCVTHTWSVSAHSHSTWLFNPCLCSRWQQFPRCCLTQDNSA